MEKEHIESEPAFQTAGRQQNALRLAQQDDRYGRRDGDQQLCARKIHQVSLLAGRQELGADQ